MRCDNRSGSRSGNAKSVYASFDWLKRPKGKYFILNKKLIQLKGEGQNFLSKPIRKKARNGITLSSTKLDKEKLRGKALVKKFGAGNFGLLWTLAKARKRLKARFNSTLNQFNRL